MREGAFWDTLSKILLKYDFTFGEDRRLAGCPLLRLSEQED